ncbi:MAG TPA: hypothetical protein V6D10_05790 [Trichocoleus sp.]|jgi:hypothetical protein
MTDLSFANLQAALPDGALSADSANNDILISLKALMNEPSLTLSDPKVSEAISKLLSACTKAQNTFNESASTDLNSFPQPIAGIPQQDNQGNWYVVFTHNISVLVPLNRDSTAAVTV